MCFHLEITSAAHFVLVISRSALFTKSFRYLVWRNSPIRICSMFSSLHKGICASLQKKTALFQLHYCHVTLPETNIFAPENGWLEYYFPFGKAYFQGCLLLVSAIFPVRETFGASFLLHSTYPFPKFNMEPEWTWKWEPWNRRFLLETIIFRFQVKLGGVYPIPTFLRKMA